MQQDAGTANPSTVAQFRAQAAAYTGNQMGDLSGVPSRTSVLDLTKPSKDTGDIPQADPFAAARLIADDTSPAIVPAWFDKAMINAMDKYRAMNTAGDRGNAG